jgi:hypothetical protein
MSVFGVGVSRFKKRGQSAQPEPQLQLQLSQPPAITSVAPFIYVLLRDAIQRLQCRSRASLLLPQRASARRRNESAPANNHGYSNIPNLLTDPRPKPASRGATKAYQPQAGRQFQRAGLRRCRRVHRPHLHAILASNRSGLPQAPPRFLQSLPRPQIILRHAGPAMFLDRSSPRRRRPFAALQYVSPTAVGNLSMPRHKPMAPPLACGCSPPGSLLLAAFIMRLSPPPPEV